MKLLFISYWGIGEGLTSATVLPHLRILAGLSNVEKIVFCSIERNTTSIENVEIDKVSHVPLFSQQSRSVLRTKITDFKSFSKTIASLCKEFSIDLMVCRSSMAGAIGYLVWRKLKISFIVESFEPHADFMHESGVWKWHDPRLWIQQYFEYKQKRTAEMILPVSNYYFKALLREGVDQRKLIMMPCCVSVKKFEFNMTARTNKRAELNFEEHDIVGIYVGKFGGIYYDDQAFKLFRSSFNFFEKSFKLIILSGDNRDDIIVKLKESEIPLDRIFLGTVAHERVPDYLSAADFAFSTIKPVPSRLFCSPIKNGEYWANGLPILTEYGIGDDSDIIRDEGGGIILDRKNQNDSFVELRELLKNGRVKLAESISKLAYKHRRLELVEDAYKCIIVNKSMAI